MVDRALDVVGRHAAVSLGQKHADTCSDPTCVESSNEQNSNVPLCADSVVHASSNMSAAAVETSAQALAELQESRETCVLRDSTLSARTLPTEDGLFNQSGPGQCKIDHLASASSSLDTPSFQHGQHVSPGAAVEAANANYDAEVATLFAQLVEESRRIPITTETRLREYVVMGRWFDEVSRKWVFDAPRGLRP